MNFKETIYATVCEKWKEIFNDIVQKSTSVADSIVDQQLLEEVKKVLPTRGLVWMSGRELVDCLMKTVLTLHIEREMEVYPKYEIEVSLPNRIVLSCADQTKQKCQNQIDIKIMNYLKNDPVGMELMTEINKIKKKKQDLNYVLKNRFGTTFNGRQIIQGVVKGYTVTATLKNGKIFREFSDELGFQPVRKCKYIIGNKMRIYFVDLEKELLDKPVSPQFDKDLARFKVLSAFVVTNQQNQNARVLSIETGSKCASDQVSKYYQSENAVLNSHAEIVARRAFKLFLYSQLNENSSDSILEPVSGGFQGHQLKSNLKLHLFISYPPCGAAQKNFGDNDYDKIRAFQSGSEGDPAKLEPARFVFEYYTCSDKLALWNTVGVQGALLSAFIKPIYLDSIIIAHPNNVQMLLNNLDNAFFGRIDPLKGNKFRGNCYSLHKPKILTLSKEKSTLYLEFTGKSIERSDSSTLSHNWIPRELEFLNSQTGFLHQSTDRNEASRLAKQSFHQLFKQLINLSRYSFKLPFVDEYPRMANSTYRELKDKMKKYQEAKDIAIETFKENELGFWIRLY